MAIDPRTPVVVGAAQLNGTSGDNEPIAMMSEVARSAELDAAAPLLATISQVRVLKGIWPYRDPGRLLAAELGLDNVTTTLSPVGGNEVFDLLNATAQSIADGELDAALLVSAETMRTRRRDKANGVKSDYRAERPDAEPHLLFGTDRELGDRVDFDARTTHAVNFYAMAETAIRHRTGEPLAVHRDRIAGLWESANKVAGHNPYAWLPEPRTAAEISTTSDANRMVAWPYTKLMTSNINVDQAAAAIVCSYEHAVRHNVPADRMVFPRSGSGAYDTWVTRNRLELDASAAMRLSAARAIELADVDLDDIAHIDLYSCFPSSVQVSQREVGVSAERPFTITGGLTFAGGPFNSYCMHSLATAVETLRGTTELALLNGNGGFFTKHSFSILAGSPPHTSFRYERPQPAVDALPSRPPTAELPDTGSIEAYTILFGRDGMPERAVLAVLDAFGSRTWANSSDEDLVAALMTTDVITSTVRLEPGSPPTARFASV